jgi:hypothetical protein
VEASGTNQSYKHANPLVAWIDCKKTWEFWQDPQKVEFCLGIQGVLSTF